MAIRSPSAGAPGPPLHSHALDEAFYVLDGELTFQLGDRKSTAKAGELVFARRGLSHTLANPGGTPARYLLVITPTGFEREFARRAAKQAGSQPPDWALQTIPEVRLSAWARIVCGVTALLAKATTANVFELDPQLLAGLPREVAADVVQCGEVEIIRTSSGIVDLDMHRQGGFGLLVLEGFLCRFAEVAGRESVELLGKGDILLPWVDDRAEAPVPVRPSHRVLVPAVLAVLDRQFAQRVTPWPTIAETICARFVDRARWLALQLALTRVRRIEDRLHVLLWHLADRWGKVQRDGTIVCSVPLTHALLAAMVGAQRPTVTSAIVCLIEEGRVSRDSEGWVLHGAPPTARDIESRTLSAAFRLRPQE